MFLEFRKELLNNLQPIDAYAIHSIYHLSPLEILNTTDNWLNHGIEAESLFQLCYVDPMDYGKIEELFLNVLDELNILKPNECEISKHVVKIIFEKMIAGKVDIWTAGYEVENIESHLRSTKSSCVDIKKIKEKYIGNKIVLEKFSVIYNKLSDGYPFNTLGLEEFSAWYREFLDCRDGSMIYFYSELPTEQALMKIKENLLLSAQKWLNEYS